MTLSEILETTTWPDVEACIRRDYVLPGEGWELALQKVYGTLRRLRPEADAAEAIAIDPIEDDDETEFHDVCGIEPGSGKRFALDFLRWERCLAMEVDPDTLRHYSTFETVAHCLMELTFYGLTQPEIAAVGTKILRRVETAKFISWEDVKKDLELD